LNLKKLNKILKKISYNKKILVSIMYINNEIGNINNINKIGKICKKYNVLFHSDFVQYIGHYNLNVKKILCDFFTVSAHKFYGPLGIGFIYIKKGLFLTKFITGGYQEKSIRSGTENLYGIVCMYKALKISKINYNKEKKYILNLKKFCINLLNKNIDNIKYNGLSKNLNRSIYNILNIRLPIKDDLLHIKLDLNKIIISKGSSCYYNKKESHVIKNILNKKIFKSTTSIRISFSIYNNKKDINIFVKKLKRIIFK
ncbi:MAG: aminotransferase class V-fold PLP-dependent enzyme, partial [Candidatus Shikimatogenerans sp. JK-2022]|nr:aminotransferase class V-fold PLP-dependent enzyme [Candidatus Shikimatogenerans bostrichidophilus]